VSTAKPSLELLRSLTDEHVLRALLAEPRLTRAELATRTGISKPTVSESVRRLAAAGLLQDTGERTTGRGRVGSYYALAADVGRALVAVIAPQGVVAEILDVRGRVIARADAPVGRAAPPAEVTRLLRETAGRARREATGDSPVRLAVVSAADPVDRTSGRLVHLPDAPFLVGELSPAEALAPLVAGPVRVDNDVNWAARAERGAAPDGELDDFGYLHLGDGLGCAVVSDGEVRRGHGGLAGEIAHVVTTGARGRATHFTEVFAELGLRRAGSTAIDTARVLDAVARRDARSVATRTRLAEAVCGVVAALAALTDPGAVVLGGSWGPAILPDVATAFARHPRPVPLRAPRVTGEPSLSGARQQALHDLRDAVLALVVMDLDTGS
jgi:predicted NBD/HSP70 family sugar kinase